MKLKENSIAKDFKSVDVFGVPISLERFKKKRVLLSFSRYTGCPICNLHVHDLLKRLDDFDKNNLVVVFISESSATTIKNYIENENLPFFFVSDPEQTLYNAYAVEKSWRKFIKWGLTIKGLYKAIKGFSKYHKFSSMKGSMNRVEAEFLINENGIIEKAHYGKMVGDYMPISSYL